MQLVIFLTTFNTSCMRLKIRCDGWKRKYFGYSERGPSPPHAEADLAEYCSLAGDKIIRAIQRRRKAEPKAEWAGVVGRDGAAHAKKDGRSAFASAILLGVAAWEWEAPRRPSSSSWIECARTYTRMLRVSVRPSAARGT
jgi:hypothetical protein